jgi:predicted O-linked N-acetylglucosamine transferase (SPINDLY family)
VLARAGLEDLATKTPDEFIAVAVQLAADRPRLAALRAGLRAQMCASPLFDPAQLAHELESLYDRLATDTGSKDELAKPA